MSTKASSLLLSYLHRHYGRFLEVTALQSSQQLILTVAPSNVVAFLTFLKFDEKLQYSQLVDVFAVDYPRNRKRFELTYTLLSIVNNNRILVKTPLEQDWTESVNEIYPSAIWLEREVWDMFGIFFYNHPDLRRILTDYGFEGYPLRKDFPLSGYTEVRYDDERKKIVSEPLRLTQEFRYFDFVSPWVDESNK